MGMDYCYMESPLGPLLLTAVGEALAGVYMDGHANGPSAGSDWVHSDDSPVLAEARRQLAAYFCGELKRFDLPLSPDGTAFQQKVWRELQAIDYGETVSYGEIARRLGAPNASRAVGLANGSNPISIVIPCHRVIGANGKLTGYGGGIERKAALLDFEKAVRAAGPHPMPAGVGNLFAS
jgi:methylated-DNA-[protein]-cysteine S-methyltransferase